MPRGRSLRFGWHFDNLTFIPVSTVQERFTGNDQIPNITVWAHTVEDIPKAIKELKAVMRKRHRNQDDFFSISEMRAGVAQLEKISKVIKIALGSIAGFSLLVGRYWNHEHDARRCYRTHTRNWTPKSTRC